MNAIGIGILYDEITHSGKSRESASADFHQGSITLFNNGFSIFKPDNKSTEHKNPPLYTLSGPMLVFLSIHCSETDFVMNL